MLMPMLSEADPKVSAEGSIDPLGLYTIADTLAVRMIPGVRERQAHPRFLTSIAVSLSLCSDFGEEEVAADGVSEPWQVFEWYLVEGLVRTATERASLRGLPGQEKATTAIKEGVPLSQKRYLKTPSVFGFHGVYRALARNLEVERADRPGEVGYELLSTWEKEQGLEGFCGTNQGPGKLVRRQLVDAIRDGMQVGAVSRKSGWSGWKFFQDHLGIYAVGEAESRVISQALFSPLSGFRKEVLNCLIGREGRSVWASTDDEVGFSERRFHEFLQTRASEELRQLLNAVSAYERFCRILQDAFDDCLFRLSQFQRRIPTSELAGLKGVRRAAREIPELFGNVAESLSPFGNSIRFQESFGSLAERLPEADWVERLLEHHCQVQYSKPPAGKATWFDRFDDRATMIRTGYVRDSGAKGDESYVHAYRTMSLWSFVRDLKLVK